MKGATRFATIAIALALALGFALPSALLGQWSNTASPTVVPPLIKFNGVITLPAATNRTSSGAPVGLVNATFSLYEFQEGGSPLWSESQKVQLDEQGRYGVLLGATSSAGLPVDLFTSGKALWLGVQPQLSGVGELPRVLLVAVPYALKAADADTLGGKPASAYALAGEPTLLELMGTAASPSASTNKSTPGNQPETSPTPLAACSAITSDGTATANSLARFTTACNLEKSLVRDTGTAVAVGGTATPGALLDVQFNSAATTGVLLGQRTLTTLSPTAASSAITEGFFSNALTAPANAQNFTGKIYAGDFETDHSGKATLTGGYGLNGVVNNKAAGTISSAYGINTSLSNLSTGKITNGYGVYVSPPVNSGGGTFSSFTGLYIASPTTVVPSAYALYSAGGKNYFGGTVGIGTLSPATTFEVNGTAKFDGLITFKSGQTFPGTLAGITPGAGILSSGGLNPTLSLNTVTTNSLYAHLTGGNTISGNQQFNSSSVTINAGTSATALTANAVLGGIAGNFTGGANPTGSGGAGGYGLNVSGGNSTSPSGNGGYGIYVNGGASSGSNGESANGIISYGGTSSNTDITPGSGIVGIGGTSFDATQTGGFGLWATGGTDQAGGVGGIGLYASGGTGSTIAQLGNAALFDGIVEVGSLFNTATNTNTMLLGSPACGPGNIGIGIGPSSFSDCAHYSLLGDGTNTILNRPPGGGLYFREANITQMTIATGGAVTIAGNLNVGGTLSKAAGSFKIDDPLDPANKYLSHSFVESPDMMNIYNGNAVLSAHGEAVIQLPKWFQSLNKDFRYQLTCIGGFSPVYIAEEIKDNRFKIAGGKPGAKVSWQVTGVRQDVYANAHRIPVEEEKPEAERGTYSYPELYGKPAPKSTDAQVTPTPRATPSPEKEVAAR